MRASGDNDYITCICFFVFFVFAVEIILVIIHITSISTAVKVLYFVIFKQPFRIDVVIYLLFQIIQFKLNKL